ncbi:hypothetical protein MMM2322_00332 [Microbacterium sp. MM2322]
MLRRAPPDAATIVAHFVSGGVGRSGTLPRVRIRDAPLGTRPRTSTRDSEPSPGSDGREDSPSARRACDDCPHCPMLFPSRMHPEQEMRPMTRFRRRSHSSPLCIPPQAGRPVSSSAMEPDLGAGRTPQLIRMPEPSSARASDEPPPAAPTAEVGGDVGLAAEGTHPVDALRDAREQVVAPAPFLQTLPAENGCGERGVASSSMIEKSPSPSRATRSTMSRSPPSTRVGRYDLDAERVAASRSMRCSGRCRSR